MLEVVSLNQNWALREEALAVGKTRAEEVSARTDGWLEVPAVPCDVHMPLLAAGKIKDPTIGNHCFECEWIEERSWWFKKEFEIKKAQLDADNVELVMEALDCMSDIFLNGKHIGFQQSAMYEFRKDVRDELREGKNELLVRLTCGEDRISRHDAADCAPWIACEWRSRDSTRGSDLRGMLRKPQYVFGWDQSLRIATCGIAGEVRLEICRDTVIRDISFRTEEIRSDGSALVCVMVEADSLAPIFAPAMDVTVKMSVDGETAACETQEHFGLPGVNYITFRMEIPNAKLWWPNGMGEPNLYEVTASLKTERGGADEKSIRAGIRTIEVCHERLNDTEQSFYFRVNGKRIFCKGVNWIPCDAVYCQTSAAFREKMLRSARDAHCNMVRRWGGNAYEPNDFYETCDRLGLMVYMEFSFACAAYPDHLEWFRSEVEKEAVYQVRRLRSHPCIAIWSGNGECTGHLLTYKGMNLFEEKKKPEFTGGTQLFNYIIPRIMHRDAPHIYYWIASPYGGICPPDGDERGDQHKWMSLDLRPESTEMRMTPEYYDTVNCKFVSEYGYFGPAKAEEVARYLGCDPKKAEKEVCKNHTNTFECGITCKAIEKHYLGTDSVSLEDFLLYGGLFQGIALEYSLGSLRCLRNNSGTLVWCLCDNFGELGFSLRDHCGNAKIAYYFVKRAYAPIRLLLRKEGETVNIWATNDTPQERTIPIEYGYVTFEGKKLDTETKQVVLEPFCKQKLIACVKTDGLDLKKGLLYASSAEENVDTAILRATEFRNLELPSPAPLTLSNAEETAEGISVYVTAEQYAHAVHFNLPSDVDLSDDYFDLLPGESKKVTIYSKTVREEDLKPVCVFVGNKKE